MPTRTIKASKGLITDLMQYFVLILLQILLAPIILKVSGQEVLGAYSIVMQVIGYGLILDLGLGVALNRYLAQSYQGSESNNYNFLEIFNIGRIFILLTNLLLAAFIIIFAFNIDNLITASNIIILDTQKSLFIFSIWIIFRTPLILYGNALIASQNMATANIIGLISGSSRLFLSIGFVYFGLGLVGLVIANVVSELLGLYLKRFFFIKLHQLINMKWKKPNFTLMKELIAFGFTYWGVNIAIVLTTGSDTILVGHLYGAAAAAVFYTTKIPAFMFIQAVFKISDNAGPAINELYSQNDFNAIRTAYLKIFRYSLLLALPLAIGIICFNKDVISLWVGPNQYAGNIMSFALALFVVSQVINHINAMIVVATGNMTNWIKISVLTGVSTIILAYFLGKIFGMQWIMVAIAILDIPVLIFLMYKSFKSIGVSFKAFIHESIFPSILSTVPLIIFVAFIFKTETTESLVGLILAIFLFCSIFVISTYSIGLSAIEKRTLIKKLYSSSKSI